MEMRNLKKQKQMQYEDSFISPVKQAEGTKENSYGLQPRQVPLNSPDKREKKNLALLKTTSPQTKRALVEDSARNSISQS